MEIASDEYIASNVRDYILSLLGGTEISQSSVHMLIASHTRLRALNLEASDSYMEYVEKLKEMRKAELEDTIVQEFIRAKLRNMTLQEVANYIGEDNG